MQLFYGVPEDIEKWMSLVTQVRWNFPGLETQEKLNEHRATVLKFMGKRQAICIKEENEIAGVMLFSRGHNMICCLAVAPAYRRRGVATMLMDGSSALNDFRLGWSDIDILVLTETHKQISESQANLLVGLRQAMLSKEPNNPYYRSFEGGMLTKSAFLAHTHDRVIYWVQAENELLIAMRLTTSAWQSWSRAASSCTEKIYERNWNIPLSTNCMPMLNATMKQSENTHKAPDGASTPSVGCWI